MLKQFFSGLLTIQCCLGLMACQPSQSAVTSDQVNANDYDAFWIWGNIKSTPYLSNAKEIYILQGEVRLEKGSNHSILIQQGISVVKIPHQKVWLVFRNHHLNWQSTEIENILQRVLQWESAGNHIQGIQIDFDVPTKNLKAYGLFLQQLRKQLPQHYQLSITSLMDWGNLRDPDTLRLFRENIDEMVIQTYQGSTTIPNYQAYLTKASTLKLPYKIGLVQHGKWDHQLRFDTDPNFKGFVVFLLRQNNRELIQ
ncbi:DUF3142 domain-containing protein [Acinetobacter sp. ULE_I057]|uniref:DUF3142 domain-containing protein n=1 Tax=Acinetobacter sp. ULE_I057 TaxID=3373070 RepID=UPI003AF599AE